MTDRDTPEAPKPRGEEARMNVDTRLTIASSVYARGFGTEVVLLHFGRGEYYGLDELGAEIWKRIEAGASIREIVDGLLPSYDVPRDVLESDVMELISHMEREGLVTLPRAPAT